MCQTKVIIIDDDRNWLNLINISISRQSDLVIAGTAQTRDDGLHLARTINFDIALVDLNLTENCFDGIELVREIVAIKKVKVIMITAYYMEDLIAQAFLSGVVNYILKTDLEELPTLIRATYKNPTLEILLHDYRKTKQELRLSMLTEAEKEVFELVRQNKSLAQISYKLNKSEGTVKCQINHIFKKLGVKSRKEAFAKLDLLF